MIEETIVEDEEIQFDGIIDIEPIPEVEEKKIENRGKPLECKYCKHKWKIPDIEEKRKWQNNNCICPRCSEEWAVLPPTERKLKYLQADYLANRCEDTIVPFIRLLDIYCQSLIKKNYKIYLTYDGALEYYSYNAVTALIEEYLSREDFKIDISFAGYMIWKIKQAIFHSSELDSPHTSLDYEFEDGNNLHEMIACDRGILDNIEKEEYTNSLYNKIIGIVEGIQDYCKNSYEDYIRTIAVHLYFKGGETAFDKLFQAFDRKGKMISMQTIDLLRKELLMGAELVNNTVGHKINSTVPKQKPEKLKYPNLEKMKQLNNKILNDSKLSKYGVHCYD
jgi:hypothetical protein